MDSKYIGLLRSQQGHTSKKLYAVVCLMLITALLLTTVSFAWISISTAPEVTNISTTLGTNGNLEIALNTNGNNATEFTAKEDMPIGINDAYSKNDYWGNVIDLRDERYGLQRVSLKPVGMNYTAGPPKVISKSAPFSVAQYATDGRITYVSSSCYLSNYDHIAGRFPSGTNYGVRVVSEDLLPADTHAFAIDLLFRTNAEDANLLLQTTGIDRIYNEDNAPDNWNYSDLYAEVQGQGSRITMNNTNLLRAIRVAFVDTATGEIYGIAKADKNGYLRLDRSDDSAVIRPMERNGIAAITAWVYLDGNIVANMHANFSSPASMKVNLQFSTDVTLYPMAGGNGESQTPTTPSVPTEPTVPTPTTPAEYNGFYLEQDGNNQYTFYSLSNGARESELSFTGSMDPVNNTVTVEKVLNYPDTGIVIPATAKHAVNNGNYSVFINPRQSPFADLVAENASIAFMPVNGQKVGLSHTTLSNLFDYHADTSIVSIDLSGLDTSTATNMYGLFYNLEALTALNLEGFDTSNATNMSNMFYSCEALTELDLSSFNTANVTNMSYMFRYCEALTELDLSSFNTANVTNMYEMFRSCKALTKLDLSSFNTAKVTDMYNMFHGCETLAELDLSSFNTANVTDMSAMFYDCEALTELDLSNFNTANVTDMSSMFWYCKALTKLDLSSFNTASVTDMHDMFSSCHVLPELDLSNFDTANVTDMSSMFWGCKTLTELDLSNFSTVNVTNMFAMFSNCPALAELDISSFNTANVTDMSHMFSTCAELTELDLSNFDTTNVTDMSGMFQFCTALTELDLSNFNTANVTDMSYMFWCCVALTELDLTGWDLDAVADKTAMFSSCPAGSNYLN